MRQLLRGRSGSADRARVSALHDGDCLRGSRRLRAAVTLAAALAAVALVTPAAQQIDQPGLTVRITSPLGRSSSPTKVRIVAQIHKTEGRSVAAVRFSVDGVLLGAVENGPPYAVEWADENPFERRDILVEAEDDQGQLYRDTVVLKPFDWNDLLIMVEGNRYRTYLNGVQMIDFTYPSPVATDGVIALQLHTGGHVQMRFKDIWIRDLSKR